MTFLTDSTIKTAIYQSLYPSKFLPFELQSHLLRPTPLNCSLTHKASVFLLSTPTGLGGFSSTTFLSDSNDLSVFLLSFPTGLGGFSSIDSSGFPPQFSHWVRRFFHQDRMTMFFIDDLSTYVVNDLSVFLLSFPLG